MKRVLTALFLLCCPALWCLASPGEHAAATVPAGTVAVVDDAKPHPAVSANPAWAGNMVGVIFFMFAMAVAVGLMMPAKPAVEAALPAPADHGHHH